MKKYIFLVCFIWLPMVAMAYGQATLEPRPLEDIMPYVFKNKSEAIKQHCLFESLKSKDRLNCIFVTTKQMHELIVGVYDPDKKGGWVLKDIMQINSWHGEATVDFEDLLGNGIKFMKIVFEGNTGTDESQKVLTYGGWHKGRFVPVLMETLSYDVKIPNGAEYGRHLNLSPKLENVGSGNVLIDLNYRYAKNEPGSKKVNFEWTDTLHWDENTFSFYNEKVERKKLLSSKFGVEKNVRKSRIKFLKKRPGLKMLSVDDLEKLGMINF